MKKGVKKGNKVFRPFSYSFFSIFIISADLAKPLILLLRTILLPFQLFLLLLLLYFFSLFFFLFLAHLITPNTSSIIPSSSSFFSFLPFFSRAVLLFFVYYLLASAVIETLSALKQISRSRKNRVSLLKFYVFIRKGILPRGHIHARGRPSK